MSDQENNQGSAGFTAPYVSFRTLENLIKRMEEEGTPQQIDRTYIVNLPGSTQSMLIKALTELGLMDGDKRPTSALTKLVDHPEDRSHLIGELVKKHYGAAINLGSNATQGQLQALFASEYGVTGSTQRKAIAFFLAAAKAGEVGLSKHFKTPKAVSSAGSPRRPRKKAKQADDPPPPPAPPAPTDDPKKAYVDLLLKKAGEEMDNTDLLDRIERVIGLDPEPSQTSPPKPPGGDPDS
ncbi:MAG: DUF5343 domain-containing protein [Solirubrobacterales bacterium]